MSRHAQAYATLATPRADDAARKMGVTGDPQAAPACLKCHATGGGPPAAAAQGFSHLEGIGCESCHGAGSEYMPEPVMRDAVASRKAGLQPVTEKTCAACHANAHGKPFDFASAKAKIAHPTRPESERAALGKRSALGAGSAQEWDVQAGAMSGGSARSLLEHFEVTYKNPVNLAFRPDGREVWVACEASGSVAVVDAATRTRVAEVTVGGQATDVAFSPDGTRAYVTSRLNDSVSVIDPGHAQGRTGDPRCRRAARGRGGPDGENALRPRHRVRRRLGRGPRERQGARRLAASRNPWSAALSPDGKRLLVTNALSRFVKFRTPPKSEVTVLDVEGKRVEARRWVVPESNLLLGVAWHPSGEFALATLNRTKNLVPMTRILQGWTITNGLAVLWKGGRVDQVLLDEPQRYFADVTDVAFTPDGKTAVATSAGSNRAALIDVEKLVALVRRTPDEERRDFLPNWLGASAEFVTARVETKDNPRGVAVAPDGKTAWVANTLDDSLSVIDLARREAVRGWISADRRRRPTSGGARSSSTTRT